MDDYLCLVCLIKAGESTAVSWQTEINSYDRRLATMRTFRRFVIDCRVVLRTRKVTTPLWLCVLGGQVQHWLSADFHHAIFIPTCRRLDREHSCRRIDQKRPGWGEGFVGRIDREFPFWQVWRQHTTWSAKYKIFRESWKINKYKYLENSDKNNSKYPIFYIIIFVNIKSLRYVYIRLKFYLYVLHLTIRLCKYLIKCNLI